MVWAPQLEQSEPEQDIPDHEGQPTNSRNDHSKATRRHEGHFQQHHQYTSQYSCDGGCNVKDLAAEHGEGDDQTRKLDDENARAAGGDEQGALRVACDMDVLAAQQKQEKGPAARKVVGCPHEEECRAERYEGFVIAPERSAYCENCRDQQHSSNDV